MGSTASTLAAPSLQTVVTLNLTSDLDYFLAGLLDNSTGGVNGSFQLVTHELPTLGLNPVVFRALANASVVNTGVYGMPYSKASPPAPSCMGLCSVWNAVSGVVTAVAGAIVGVVWNAAVAAAEYLGEELHGLANAVAQGAAWVAATTVATLKAAAALLEAALQALLAFIEKEVTALLDSALAPLKNAITTLADAYLTPLADAACGCQGGGNGLTQPTQAYATALLNRNLQTLLNVMTIVVITVSIALTVLDVLSLGTGELLTFLLPVIVIAVFSFAGSLGSGSSQLSSSVSSIFSSLTSDLTSDWGLVTDAAQSGLLAIDSGLSNSAKQTLHTIFAFVSGFADMIAGITLVPLFVGAQLGGQQAIAALGFVLAAVGLLLELSSLFLVSFGPIVLSTLAVSGVVLDLWGLIDLLGYEANPANKRSLLIENTGSILAIDEILLSIGFATGAASVATIL